ncbi:leucine-rich repeat-containing protein kinase family protein [Hymenobacter glacialis]|uniref:Protein kinase n=1 Tax=Hymenobacter glacialis TaxID=1908236 RepID=A0A1G1SZJ4_9BACT|nr:leucine-rich repeat-containing protein kinase family protein [Hymenobacter glacialis]OGX84039.1 protein kinase [Hymenobacter glacialis]
MHTLEQLRSGKLAGTQRLDLAEGLTEFPREILDLADTLEVLNLTGNALSTLPDDLGRLRKLRVLFCSNNQFTEVPAVLGQCPQLRMVGFKANRIRTLPAAALPPALRWLILTDNQLQALPREIGACSELQKLMLAGNQLRELPDSLAACTRLELLRIAANQFEALPEWLLRMPRLSWLAYAGNPFAEPAQAAALERHPIGTIAWGQLQLEQQLGEGASGVIHQARLRREGAAAESVAVKLFKGALTSDGLPQSEMAACISAGAHPNLIGLIGKVSEPAARAEGLVLELISPAFGNLAGPPSFETCTRDVYAATASFGLETVLRTATGIAGAAAHLHAQGILHGDLYAHNILVTATGEALLGDFGAACFFDAHQTQPGQALQQLEARAFGCLLEELLKRCVAPPAAATTAVALWKLQRQCAQPEVAARPLFPEIYAALSSLQRVVSGEVAG